MSAPFSRLNAAAALTAFLLALGAQAQERSLLVERPADPVAAFVDAPAQPEQDATAALQGAIDHVQATTRRGIVFLGPGRYRIAKTVQVWAGIRLIGYGPHRPVLVLAPGSFPKAGESHPMLHYAGERPDDPRAEPQPGNSGTFYSGLINVDLELGRDNAGGSGVSFHVAQHGVLSHVRIDATGAFAAIDGAGSSITDVELVGGNYGIVTHQTAASWPYLLMDSVVAGQRLAAVRNSEATATFVRDTFRDVPMVLRLDDEHPVQVYVRDSLFAHVSGPAISPTSGPEPLAIALDHIHCDQVSQLTPSLASPSPAYTVDELRVGLSLAPNGIPLPNAETHHMHVDTALLKSVPSDAPALPLSANWRSLRDFGAKGDDHADDTAALRRAIASGAPIYLPQGRYRVSEPITLGAATVLVGFNPITTQITLADNTPAFAKRASTPTAILIAPRASHPKLIGIGLSTGGINPAASALLWRAARGLVDDVRILGGHGTALPNGHYRPNYNADRTADPDPARAWDTQPPSILVMGGGGTFRNIWTPNSYAAAGFAARDTAIPSRLYLISAEHHVRNELTLDHVRNWQFFGLQTEEEKTEGSHGVPLVVRNSTNLLFANSIFYRVSRSQNAAPTAVALDASDRITFVNADNRSQSPFPFESTITARTSNVRAHFFNSWSDRR